MIPITTKRILIFLFNNVILGGSGMGSSTSHFINVPSRLSR
jgi:hypothetical protein